MNLLDNNHLSLESESNNMINECNIIDEYNKIKMEYENCEKDLLDYYTIDSVNNIKLNCNFYLESDIKAKKQFAQLCQKYNNIKEKYNEKILSQLLSDSNSNNNYIKEYIDNKLNSLSVYNSTEFDYEYKLIEISKKLQKYKNKYDFYIFCCIYMHFLTCKGNENDYIVFDKFKFATIKTMVPILLSEFLNGNQIKKNNFLKMNIYYYDEIKKHIYEQLKDQIKNGKFQEQNSHSVPNLFLSEYSIFTGIYSGVYNNYYKDCSRIKVIEILYQKLYDVLLLIYKNILFYEKVNFDMNFLQDMAKKIMIGKHDNNCELSLYDYYQEITEKYIE